MALVGCIAGALHIDEYGRLLKAAGFSSVEVVDARADLNAYASVEGQAGCCSPGMSEATSNVLPIASGCNPEHEQGVHAGLAHLLSQYDINEYAASVKVFALRP
jgi:hypothetical protein